MQFKPRLFTDGPKKQLLPPLRQVIIEPLQDGGRLGVVAAAKQVGVLGGAGVSVEGSVSDSVSRFAIA